jgi:diamine N-acetyltransferase
MPTSSPVSLREITADTVVAIVKLAVAPEQNQFVASNAVSLAQALFAPEAWYRAIYCGDAPAGFVMLSDTKQLPQPPADPKLSLWRLMVDHRFQGQGVGAQALGLVFEHGRRRGYTSIDTSYVAGEGSPVGFYSKMGFVETGRMDDDEHVIERALHG